MAIEFEAAKLLKSSSDEGIALNNCLTIGRQTFLPSEAELKKIFGKNFQKIKEIKASKYAENFFYEIGAKKVDSIDFSDYENASIIGDLNKRLKIKEKFDLIFDGGSLEHIFNVPQALENYISMLKIGGRFIGYLPVNNQIGHGFYQFSPELFFRVFSENNGFVVEKSILVEYGPKVKLFQIIDPYRSKYVSHTINKYPAYIYFQAKKYKSATLFKKNPSQYIYSEDMWAKDVNLQKKSSKLRQSLSNFKKRLFNINPSIAKSLDNIYHSSINSNYSLRNKKLFKRIR